MKRFMLAVAALLCLAAFTARAADDLPPGVTRVKPEVMKWEKSASGRERCASPTMAAARG